jgi:GDP-4-dehydro-6-deoxy-D-mannose reductase
MEHEMKALITGVTGFAGSHLADYLIDREGLEVHGVRRPRSRIEFIRDDVLYHEGDITDFCSIAGIIKIVRPDYIFHLAAQSFVPLSWEAPWPTLETNIMGTLNILEAVSQHLPQVTVLVAGSSEEYGLVAPNECPITEQQPLRPLSPYAVSKVAADLLAQQYHYSYGLRTIITRAFNHTGPRRGENFVTSKIARQLALIKLGKAKPNLKLGNLQAVRDFTDVRDTVRAYWLAVNRCLPGIPYNIGTGTGHSIQKVLDLLKELSGVNPVIKREKQFFRPSDVPLLVCDSSAFREVTGWQPRIPFEQTMKDLFDYWMGKLR